MFSLFLLLFLHPLTSQAALEYYTDVVKFFSPEQGHYAETSIFIAGKSLNVVQMPEKSWRAEVEILITFSDFQKIVSYDKFILSSQPLNSANETFTLLDVKRFSLPPGKYVCEIEMTDINAPGHTGIDQTDLEIIDYGSKVYFSDIVALESYSPSSSSTTYTKNGYELIPYVVPYFPNSFTTLRFYSELYNTDKNPENADLLLSYSLVEEDLSTPIANLKNVRKEKAKPVIVLMGETELAKLSSGNYYLLCEARNRKNEVVASNSLKIQRNNIQQVEALENIHLINTEGSFVQKLTDEETLFYTLSLAAITVDTERQYIINLYDKKDPHLSRKFLHNFWVAKDGANPEKIFLDHKKRVDYAQQNYATQIRKGFDTDRGRIWVNYGEPNETIIADYEPGAKPYQIWKYAELPGSQINVEFVFMNADIVTNDYRLIHSNLRGEISDPRWKMHIYDNNPSNEPFDFDRTTPNDHYGQYRP